MMFRVLLFLVFFCAMQGGGVNAQNMRGTWEGEMNGELLRISVEQKDMQICGFTHDHVLEDTTDFCTAAYSGAWLTEQKAWLLSGTRFIRNSGSHVLMRILLWNDPAYGTSRLRARVTTESSFLGLFGAGAYNVVLRRVSWRPAKLPYGQPNCFPKPKPVPRPPTRPVAQPVKPRPVPAVTRPNPQPVKPKPAPASPVPGTRSPQSTPPKQQPITRIPQPLISAPELIRKMTGRKQIKQSTVEVNVKRINLKVYDNGDIDNDTVSIFYNGKLLLSHQRLSDKPIVIDLDLDDSISEHTLTMYAENLGGIPPNTALIVVTAGDKRYELRSKADLKENAVLVFEYKPK